MFQVTWPRRLQKLVKKSYPESTILWSWNLTCSSRDQLYNVCINDVPGCYNKVKFKSLLCSDGKGNCNKVIYWERTCNKWPIRLKIYSGTLCVCMTTISSIFFFEKVWSIKAKLYVKLLWKKVNTFFIF